MKTSTVYFALGRPFSPLYSLVMRLRAHWYQRGLLRSYRMSTPVISVGNLTMGGSGKTPMVQYLARRLQEHGYHPAIISRGYGGKATGAINIVTDGSTLFMSAEQAGDEPRLLAETLPGVPVLTGVVRRFPAQQAIEMGADILLLDDGFQHLQIRRDVDLVLLNADRPVGNSRVFPGGDLREPIVGLRRATGCVVTGVREENREQADQLTALLQGRFPGIPVTQTGYGVAGPVCLNRAGLLEPVDATVLGRGRRWFGFAGIAQPDSFRRTLERHGVTLADFQPLDDHQHYSPGLVAKLAARAVRAGSHGLITTEKDLVKLATAKAGVDLPLLGLRMQVEADPSFMQSILSTVRSATDGHVKGKEPTV